MAKIFTDGAESNPETHKKEPPRKRAEDSTSLYSETTLRIRDYR